MTKGKLYTISVVALIIAVALPICSSFCGKNYLEVVNSVSALIGALCGAITLLIAILLYNKYGVDQSVTDKNVKLVFEIVSELKKTVVFAESVAKNGAYFIQFNFWTIDTFELDDTQDNPWLNDTVYITLNYAYALEHLFELSHDPFAPKEIATAIKGIELYSLSEVKEADREERSAIVFAKSNEKREFAEMVGKLNGEDMTLREFIRRFQSVKTSIKAWLISHNADETSLNF